MKSSEVLELGHAITIDFDESIVGRFLGVFIHETTRVDASHLSAVQSLDFLELSGVGIATVFGKEKRDPITSEVLDLLIPTRNSVGRWVTP